MTQTTATDAHRIEAPHAPEDDAKLGLLIEAMQANGWQGAPVVVIDREDADPLAVTGSHRIAAAREADIDVPTVDLAELLAEHGVNLAEMITDFEAGGYDTDSAILEAAIRGAGMLPADVADHYGLDLH
ncbi:hypothetical protein E1258_09465 [Micromonospora sp. KC207]|uniref:ParB N-terminal domain-containing protein n=1 Tax=Micromonospora sp. KC207 TaxID=2530377 RepID=UPI0010436781|nr:ParB N-terminal domain-containing protein [Micromonospora sp. KC207]TDC63865.1 hypothetical protein E1258_09465 [Micromonospora sp. KC207]